MMMGMEFFAVSEYHRCIMLMIHVLREFGRDKGTMLLFLVAECGLRAACCDGDITAYLNFLVFLLKRDLAEYVDSKRRELLWNNFLTVMDKKLPVAEADCEMNTEKWMKAMSSPVTSYVGVHREGVLDAVFYFASDTVRAATLAEVKVVLTYVYHH